MQRDRSAIEKGKYLFYLARLILCLGTVSKIGTLQYQ